MALKILLTGFDYPPRIGGVATCGFETAKALARAGVELRVLAKKWGDVEEADLACPFRTRRVELPRSAIASVPAYARALSREVREFRPDVVLSLLWMPDGLSAWAGLMMGRPPRPRWYVWAHGVEILESEANLRKRVRKCLSPVKRKVFKDCDGVFAVSAFTKGLVERHCGIPSDKISVIYNGVDSERFTPVATERGIEGPPVFLTVSRIEDYKGVDVAIRGFARFRAKFPGARYYVVGDGPDLMRLRSLARDLGFADSVIFTGKASQDELLRYYRSADAFVLLTRDDFVFPNVEGFGIVFLEAAACGLPSIGGRSGGISDAIVDGKTGMLVDPLEPEGVSAAMEFIASRRDEARRMGDEGRARALREFSWAAVAERILKKINVGGSADVRD